MNLILPKEIENIVTNLNYTIDIIGRSTDKVILFENKYVLKISDNKDILYREMQMNDFLYNKIPSSKSILFTEYNNKYYYLRTIINGKSLIDNKFISNPNLLIKMLVKSVNLLKSLDKYNCPIKSLDNKGNNFIHGDLCLPNIYITDDNEIAGFIDLGNAGIGDRWYDYSWLIWSFEYNLKTNNYTNELLKQLNIQFDINKYNEYIPKEYQNK